MRGLPCFLFKIIVQLLYMVFHKYPCCSNTVFHIFIANSFQKKIRTQRWSKFQDTYCFLIGQPFTKIWNILKDLNINKRYSVLFFFLLQLLGFMYSWLTFYHSSHEVAKDHKPHMTELQSRIQTTRDHFNASREDIRSLMSKMLEVRQSVRLFCCSL